VTRPSRRMPPSGRSLLRPLQALRTFKRRVGTQRPETASSRWREQRHLFQGWLEPLLSGKNRVGLHFLNQQCAHFLDSRWRNRVVGAHLLEPACDPGACIAGIHFKAPEAACCCVRGVAGFSG
jgi:hypothetical protein